MTKIKIYTDGACSGNPGKGGYGFIIIADGYGIKKKSEGYRRTTNNRMEILAAIKALSATEDILADLACNKTERRETDIKVTVFSDSQLLINTMNIGWSKKTNEDLWRQLDNVISKLNIHPTFVKVKAHADNPFNNEADRLAVLASKEPTSIDTAYEAIAGQPSADAPQTPEDLFRRFVEENPCADSLEIALYMFEQGRRVGKTK